VNNGSLVLQGYIGGLTLSNDATSPNVVIDVAAGVATSDDPTPALMKIVAFTKNCNAAWAVGTGAGGLDSGSALLASTWYHVFVIERTDTSVVDELCSTSPISPTLPANYTKKRRIGSIKTDSGSHIIAFAQNGDLFLWKAANVEIDNVAGSTSATLQTLLGIPSGIQVIAYLTYGIQTTAAPGAATWISSPDENAVAPWSLGTGIFNASLEALSVSANGYSSGDFQIRTNTAAQVRHQETANAKIQMYSRGWIDTRGRFN
jgi:hypothetical protein